ADGVADLYGVRDPGGCRADVHDPPAVAQQRQGPLDDEDRRAYVDRQYPRELLLGELPDVRHVVGLTPSFSTDGCRGRHLRRMTARTGPYGRPETWFRTRVARGRRVLPPVPCSAGGPGR